MASTHSQIGPKRFVEFEIHLRAWHHNHDLKIEGQLEEATIAWNSEAMELADPQASEVQKKEHKSDGDWKVAENAAESGLQWTHINHNGTRVHEADASEALR